MGFFHEYYGHLFGRTLDGLPEVRFNRELEYRPYDREDLEMVHEAGVSMTNMMRLMTSPGGLGTLHLLVAVERLHRFRDPSGFRDEQLRQILETLHPGRGTEENVRAFRAALASRDVLRLRFIHHQCARAAAELSRAMAELFPGREMDVPTFRAALAAHEGLRVYFMTYQCARLVDEMD